MDKIYTVGNKTFLLDQEKAEKAFAEKRVINGRESMCFNLLPLKYNWAYDLYKAMKANHWAVSYTHLTLPTKRIV